MGGKGTPICSSISRLYWNARCSVTWAAKADWIAPAEGDCSNNSIIFGSLAAAMWVSIWARWSCHRYALTGFSFIKSIFSATGSRIGISFSNGMIWSASLIPKTSSICLWSCGMSYICGAVPASCRAAWYCMILWAIVAEFGSETGITSIRSSKSSDRIDSSPSKSYG